MRNILIVGGGPAGMMAALTAAQTTTQAAVQTTTQTAAQTVMSSTERGGCRITLLEKNDRLGRKLYLTGKGRCNVTNDTSTDGLMAAVNTNGRFLYGAFNRFSSADVIQFFEHSGVPLKTERGRRVFPVSDRSADIVHALERQIHDAGVEVLLRQEVRKIEKTDGFAFGVAEGEGGEVRGVHTRQGFIAADAVIVATGGLSYAATGSTGDGYRFARDCGHNITALFPSLVPLRTAEPWVSALEGLSLKNIRLSVWPQIQATTSGRTKKPLFTDMGEMLFTGNGVSGPLVLSASRFAAGKSVALAIDLKPALSREALDERILRDFQMHMNKDFANGLDGLLPKRLIPVVVALSSIPPTRKIHAITREERRRLGALLKCLPLTVTESAGYGEAVITMGGVDVREIDPKTMMSKKIRGLYFAGEVLDVDAMTGGYNLQIAFSTGYLAGKSAVDINHAIK